jgi:hypothetical protein
MSKCCGNFHKEDSIIFSRGGEDDYVVKGVVAKRDIKDLGRDG